MNEYTRPTSSDDIILEAEYDSTNPRFGRVRRSPGRNTIRRPAHQGFKMVPIERTDPRKIDIQIYGEYQLFGDIETDAWEKRTFEDHKADGTVIDYSLLYVTTGAWGLRFVTFMVDTSVDVGETDQIRAQAQDVLFKIFGESDVELRYITML